MPSNAGRKPLVFLGFVPKARLRRDAPPSGGLAFAPGTVAPAAAERLGAAVVAAAGLIVLVYLARHSAAKVASLSLYGATLVLMFSASAAYHMAQAGPSPLRPAPAAASTDQPWRWRQTA